MKNKEFFISSIFIVFMWLVYILTQTIVAIYKNPELLHYAIGFAIYRTIIYSIVTITLFYLFKKHFFNKPLNKKRVLVLIVGLLILSSVFELLSNSYYFYYHQRFFFDLAGFVLRSALKIFTLIPFLVLFVVFKLLKERDEEKRKFEEAKNLAREAKLEMLSYQLNPHFLFNALNTIMALIDYDKEQAREIITDLSDYLRYSLNNSKKREVTLEEEYKSVLDYLKIQKKRFKDKIEIRAELDEKIRKRKVPVFIIHPLVENAVKHGTRTCKGILKIFISIKNVENDILVEVKNSGKMIENPEQNENGTGTGLSNTIKRVSLLYGPEYGVTLSEKDGMITCRMKLGSL